MSRANARRAEAPVLMDLVMDTGELVRIECRRQDEDAVLESLEHDMKRRDWWAPRAYERMRELIDGARK